MYTFILDVDGVLTDGTFLYNENGKAYKVFGPDDADALKLLSKYINIVFMSQDKKGFAISKKRVNDMGFELLEIASRDRAAYIGDHYGLENAFYMGDSFSDIKALKACKCGICTKGSSPYAIKVADYVTTRNGGDRAVAEACFYIAENFLGLSVEQLLEG